MSKSKKIFLIIAFIFFVLLAWVSYDISSRTSFPGSQKLLEKELIDDKSIEEDSL